MTYLCIRTDKPTAELYLYENDALHDSYTWLADRQLAKGLLYHIAEFLKRNDQSFTDLDGIVVFRGPGSFTGLRIGITVANVMAYSLDTPIIGGETDDNWIKPALQALLTGENERIVLPLYGSDPRITTPRK